jgi:hypothetical protein
MAVGKPTPPGDPAPNAPKWLAAVEIIRLAADADSRHKATREIAKYGRNQRECHQSFERSWCIARQKGDSIQFHPKAKPCRNTLHNPKKIIRNQPCPHLFL